jgi:hypothetical protein
MPGKSQLTFWYDEPEMNSNFKPGVLGEYYMPFYTKAKYNGDYDEKGIPLLDYHGRIGKQYNPIAISQYGLGSYNLHHRTNNGNYRESFIKTADWLVNNLENNSLGIKVWNHHFDWEYRQTLKAPWYSGLAQGQGISVLVRAWRMNKNDKYKKAAQSAFESMTKLVSDGGVLVKDTDGNAWIEEYIVDPPTHILNGFIWALWGVYDYMLAFNDKEARKLFDQGVVTLKKNLSSYDTGFWSLYELSGTKMRMLASPFYHRLHITQLKVMYKLTEEKIFQDYAFQWAAYSRSFLKRTYALIHKSIFKIFYY